MHDPKRMRRARRSCSMTEVVSRALGAARWSSRTERAAGPKPGGPGSHHGSRRGVDRHWHGRTVSQISRAGSSSASARGSPSRSARGGSYPGSQSHSAAASRSISPSTESRRHGRRASCSQRRWRRPLSRHRPFAFPLAMGAAALAAGLATATAKRVIIAHPVLSAALWNVDIAGFVEVREERERSDRIVVRVERIAAPRLEEPLERVRVSVRKGTAPAVGAFVEFKARLSPPLEPLRPGGYDFARDMYFNRIGASGFVLGRIRDAEMPHAPSLRLRYATVVDGMREAIDQRIRAVLPGDKGAIASAVITGKRDAISPPVNEAMYVSGLAHVLSISGYHMAVVAGMIFFALRAVFALLPAFSNRHPIKKWAALAALGAAAFYLLLSGAEVATQRSFIMIAIVLIGIMVDRPTLTFRTL